MLRFSELELKERGRGEEEEEEREMTAAVVATGEKELAASQQGDGGREEVEENGKKKGGGGWERCQQSEGQREGGGRSRSAAAADTEAPREPPSDGEVYDILADPPGPEDEEDEEEGEDKEQHAQREVFEFELSDRPLLLCYNIQVLLSQGPRNWLLLADVLGRLWMTSRSFRRLFPQINVQSFPEEEFHRQASLSQLLTGPDEQELVSLRPDVKGPLELVEATPELAGMLGSSLEFVDSQWDSLNASPHLRPSVTFSCVPVLFPPQPQGAEEGNMLHNRTKSIES